MSPAEAPEGNERARPSRTHCALTEPNPASPRDRIITKAFAEFVVLYEPSPVSSLRKALFRFLSVTGTRLSGWRGMV